MLRRRFTIAKRSLSFDKLKCAVAFSKYSSQAKRKKISRFIMKCGVFSVLAVVFSLVIIIGDIHLGQAARKYPIPIFSEPIFVIHLDF